MEKTILIASFVASALSAHAALSYDQNVNDPGPGVFYGTGNGNGGWTVDSQNGIELGIRTHQRYPAPADVFNSAGNGNYNWSDTTGYGSSPGNRASWNYDFSLNVAGTISQALTDYVFTLWIDSDPGAGHSWTVIDPSAIPDNATSGSAYEQNSENPRFTLVGIPGYDNTIAGTYDFSLRASDLSGNLLANTYMRVNVNGGTASGTFNGNVPDAGSTFAMLAAAGTALLALRRKN